MKVSTQCNYKEFCKALEDASPYFKWKINKKTCSIRATKSGHTFCPITVVAYWMTGRGFKVNKWAKAARIIGLPFHIANMIAQSSDSGLLFNAELEDQYFDLIKRIEK